MTPDTTPSPFPSNPPTPLSISSFTGPFRFLNNSSPPPITLDRIIYPTVEHASHAATTLDAAERRPIARCPTPGHAQRMGHRTTRRPDWEAVKIPLMRQLLRHKFTHSELATTLLRTAPHPLVNGHASGDTFWGVSEGAGENGLGRLVMEIRETITP